MILVGPIVKSWITCTLSGRCTNLPIGTSEDIKKKEAMATTTDHLIQSSSVSPRKTLPHPLLSKAEGGGVF